MNAPILFCICDKDAVAPAETALRYAATAPRGEVKRYPVGHFDIYLGEPFEHAVRDQTEFLVRHLEVAIRMAMLKHRRGVSRARCPTRSSRSPVGRAASATRRLRRWRVRAPGSRSAISTAISPTRWPPSSAGTPSASAST